MARGLKTAAHATQVCCIRIGNPLQYDGARSTVAVWLPNLSGGTGFQNIAFRFKKRPLYERDARENRLSFHCLRHTSVTLLKEAGVPDAAIMALIGHGGVEHRRFLGLHSFAGCFKCSV